LTYDSRVAPAQFQVNVVSNRGLTGGYFVLELESEADNPVADAAPGQFVMLRGDWGRDLLNGRAFSVLQPIDGRRFTVMMKVFGRGTAKMQAMGAGETLTVTGPLGRGFPKPGHDGTGRRQLLIAGGVGLPPLHFHARRAVADGAATSIELFYGGRRSEDLVLTSVLDDWGVPTVLATEDGSRGEAGRVTVPLVRRIEEAAAAGESVELLACGPTPMLEAVREIGMARDLPTYICLEEMMACGFGVCLGCAVPVYGDKPYKYCCTDGPVFEAREVRW